MIGLRSWMRGPATGYPAFYGDLENSQWRHAGLSHIYNA